MTWPSPSAVTTLPYRGAWTLPGDATALWVFGSAVYLMEIVTPATRAAFPTFSVRQVGRLYTNYGRVSIRDNGPGGYAVIVDGANGYFYNIATQVLTRITDPNFLGATTVSFIDGWWIFNQPGTQNFYTTVPQYTTTLDPTYYALKDAATDKLVGVIENKEQLWLLGADTTEIWYNAGGQFFPFQRLVSTMLQIGCAAPHSACRYYLDDSGLIWLAKSERGSYVVVQTKGFTAEVVSTPAVQNAISKYPYIADATGDVYTEDTHEFYVLTFPTMNKTWVYDLSTKLWHERGSFDPSAGLYNQVRYGGILAFQNMVLGGDYQNGQIYRITRAAFTDAGWPLRASRRTPHIWDQTKRGRIFYNSLQVEFSPGVGDPTTTDPQAMLRMSNDGGTTWGNELTASIGGMGMYLNRAVWRRLGQARDRVFEVSVIDPVNRDIVGASLVAKTEFDIVAPSTAA